MSDGKKKRLSMLDKLAPAPETKSARTPPAPMSENRALKAARDAVDGHHVWELDPSQIIDDRPTDRLDQDDVEDLRDAIEANGQTVPILVRRHDSKPDRYLLVYGRRRLEAIKFSSKVKKVRAIVASMDDGAAVRAQVSENMARRDLTYIEKALFAHELVGSGFGSQKEVAEVLTVSKSAISMALSSVERISPELIRAIGPAQGVGRPRWDALAQGLDAAGLDGAAMLATAEQAYADHAMAMATDPDKASLVDPSVAAFEAVLNALPSLPAAKPAATRPAKASKSRSVAVAGVEIARVRLSDKGLQLDLPPGDFATWFNSEGERLLKELHTRWKNGAEDQTEQLTTGDTI